MERTNERIGIDTSVESCNQNNLIHSESATDQHPRAILLHGFLKTRYIDITHNDKKSIFGFNPSWKLRYWRLVLLDEGLMFEKSRRSDTKAYKGVLLPFGKTLVWENWGKDGDTKYSFGFTVRVMSANVQMEAAVDSEQCRGRWTHLLQSAFCSNVQDTREMVKVFRQHTSNKLSKSTDASSEDCNSLKWLVNLQGCNNETGCSPPQVLPNVNSVHVNAHLATDTISTRGYTSTRTDTERTGRSRCCTIEDSDCKSLDELVRDDNIIPRRYHAELYDNDGCMSDHLEKKRLFHVDNLPDIVDEPEPENRKNCSVSHSNKKEKHKKRSDSSTNRIVLKPKKKKTNDISREDVSPHFSKKNHVIINDSNIALPKLVPTVSDLSDNVISNDSDHEIDGILNALGKKSFKPLK